VEERLVSVDLVERRSGVDQAVGVGDHVDCGERVDHAAHRVLVQIVLGGELADVQRTLVAQRVEEAGLPGGRDGESGDGGVEDGGGRAHQTIPTVGT
jgi:hypothetical protein